MKSDATSFPLFRSAPGNPFRSMIACGLAIGCAFSRAHRGLVEGGRCGGAKTVKTVDIRSFGT
jgi:hypothetical protein